MIYMYIYVHICTYMYMRIYLHICTCIYKIIYMHNYTYLLHPQDLDDCHVSDLIKRLRNYLLREELSNLPAAGSGDGESPYLPRHLCFRSTL